MKNLIIEVWSDIKAGWRYVFGKEEYAMTDTPIYDALEREWAHRGWAVVGRA